MRGRRVTDKEKLLIVSLRSRGYSLPEIMRATNRGGSTVFQYAKGVQIKPKYYNLWKSKQGASKYRAFKNWEVARDVAKKVLGTLNKRDKILIAASLYWGEGAKKDLSLSNTDAGLIKAFVDGLKELGITKDKLKVSIRIYEDINRNSAISYWAKIIDIPKKQISSINILKGKKEGKLKYGMCRIRVSKGGNYFKIIKSVIDLIKLKN